MRPSFSTTDESERNEYVSPLQELFDRMEANGPTTLGTTTEFDKPTAANDKLLKCGIPESALRFTTTSYGRIMMAPHVHPKEHQVVLKVGAHNLPLNDLEIQILKEIVGNRLNEERNELRLTSDQFGSRIENKRHLVSMLDRIVLSCQRLGKEIELHRPQTKQSSEEAAVA